MPAVHFTRHLQRFFPALAGREPGAAAAVEVPGATVAEVVRALDGRFPGLAAYLVDERGSLRKHVNIFVGDELVRDRVHLSDPVPDGTPLHVIQALSGG